MDRMKTIGTLSLDGNASENWRKWKQRWNLYSVASGANNKPEATQCAIFLHTIGQEALDVYNTFTFTEGDENKIDVLVEKLKTIVHGKRILPTRDINSTRARKMADHSTRF